MLSSAPSAASQNNSHSSCDCPSFIEQNVFFVMLDSNIMGAGNESDVRWLEEQLTSTNAIEANWRIVVCHHPFFPIVDIPKDITRAQTMQTTFLPILESTGVDIILCGHQHIYSRTKPIVTGTQSEKGIIQVMTASGAKSSYTVSTHNYIEKIADSPTYLILESGKNVLKITAYNADRTVIDSFQCHK